MPLKDVSQLQAARDLPGGADLSVSPEQMKQVLDVSRMLAVTTDLNPLLLRIAEACTSLLGCDRASIFVHDKKSDELWTKIALHTEEIRIPAAKGIAGTAFTQNQILHVSDPYADPRFNQATDKKTGYTTRNLMTCPMVDLERKPIGVIQAVNKLGSDFHDGDRALIQLLADQAGVAIQRYHLQAAAIEMITMRREMDLARQVQQALIPKKMPEIPGIIAAGWNKPASMTGGDCFDLWKTCTGDLGMFVADASGHGIAPALVVSQTRTLIRCLCESDPDPHELLTRVNRRLAEDLDPGWFVTAFLAFLTPAGKLTWSSAGHGPVFIRTGAGPAQALEPFVPPLGVLAELPPEHPEPVQFAPGDTLLISSDGLFESTNPDGEQFGIQRIADLLDTHPNATPDQIIAMLRDAVIQWHTNDDPIDDQTLILAKRV
ncbi:MAG TPA: GAF domain-containing SpoIIE family protein phosphatase [Tepidisphaeraceae bacterium]|jgi:phosphoserine phosphatase|nr:GAF domain-containing SpoIIE family protein phosphatase [Tepidisphaeraceae bacterium]